MSWFGSDSESTSVSNTYNTNASATQGNSGSASTLLGGLNLASGSSLTLTDLGAVNAAFKFADDRYGSLEQTFGQVVERSQSQISEAQRRSDTVAAQAAAAIGAQSLTPLQRVLAGALAVGGVILLVQYVKR